MSDINLTNNFNLGDDFTDRQLKAGYWFVTHRLAIEKWSKIALVVLTVLIWVFVVWQVVFIIIDYNVSAAGLRRIVFNDGINYDNSLSGLAPQSLQVSSVRILSGSGGRNDLVAAIKNPNGSWLATFNYKFAGASAASYTRKGFVLPGEEKYLLESASANSAANLEITDLEWSKFTDFVDLYNDRFNFLVENNSFTRSGSSQDPSILTFDITNKSAFSYWEVEVQAFLYSGGNLASLNSIVLDKFKSGEKRNVSLYWYNTLPQISNVEIIPAVNILDEDNIIPPEGEVGEYR